MEEANRSVNHDTLTDKVHTVQIDNKVTSAGDISTEVETLVPLGFSQVQPPERFSDEVRTITETGLHENPTGFLSKCREEVELVTIGECQKAGCVRSMEDECRICQSNGDENLISPCKCSGSAKWVHQSCLIKWFQISHTSSCDLCSHHVLIKKTTKPVSEWRVPRGSLGPCSRVDLWYLFVTVFSVSTILAFCIFQILVKSKELETTVVFSAIYVLCGVMIILRVRYFYQWFTQRSAFWRKWRNLNQLWTVVSPSAVLETKNSISTV